MVVDATLKDVARAAGVSVKTVSNVVNGYEHVSAKTRVLVEKAIADLDYRPNIAARNLRRGSTGLVAVAVPTLKNPYFAELAQVLVETANAHDLTVLVDCTGGEPERERRVSDGFSTHLVDGLILCPHALTPADLKSRRSRTPLVLLSERKLTAADSVAVDSRAAARAATEHLLATGRRRIAVIGFPARPGGPMHARRRLEGYRAALESAGIAVDERLIGIFESGQEMIGGAPAVGKLCARMPKFDAIFCYNDQLALAAIRYLLSVGKRVPEDVAVIGIDDIAAGRLSTPTLSTIQPDTKAIADHALTLLQARVGGDESAAQQIVVDHALVVRESTVAASG